MAFDFNPNDVTVGFEIFDKGAYELEIGEPKSFAATGKEGKPDNYGVRYMAKIVEGPKKGKKFMVNCYMHTEESQAFSKAFLMAALGFNPRKQEDEKAFNEKYANENWRFNPDDKSAGDMWHKVKNQRVVVELDTGIGKDGTPQAGEKVQKIIAYRPLSGATAGVEA